MERELLEGYLGEGMSLQAIGRRTGRHPSTVAYWLAHHGLRAAGGERHSARGGVSRDAIVAWLTAGLTHAEMAERHGCSPSTIRYWLRRHGLQSANGVGRRPAPRVVEANLAALDMLEMPCPRHGTGIFVRDGRGYYRCRRCRSEEVARRRRKVKAILVAEAGGGCAICGYARSPRALHFHHLDPASKRIEINAKGVALSLDTLRAEARKCVLLCSNCHAEVEDRLVNAPMIEAAGEKQRPGPG